MSQNKNQTIFQAQTPAKNFLLNSHQACHWRAEGPNRPSSCRWGWHWGDQTELLGAQPKFQRGRRVPQLSGEDQSCSYSAAQGAHLNVKTKSLVRVSPSDLRPVLGWLDVPPFCFAAQPTLPNFHLPKQNLAVEQPNSKPTHHPKVSDQMGHPVQGGPTGFYTGILYTVWMSY